MVAFDYDARRSLDDIFRMENGKQWGNAVGIPEGQEPEVKICGNVASMRIDAAYPAIVLLIPE